MRESLERRWEFWRRVLRVAGPRGMDAVAGGRHPVVILIVGLLGYFVGANLTGPGSLLSVGIMVVTLVGAIGEASYLEWTRWAPHQPPNLLVERRDWPARTGQYAGVIVTNDDVDGLFRASIVVVKGRGDRLRWGPSDMWPHRLGWGDSNAPERHLVRGEREIIRIVQFAGSDNGGGQERYYAFKGPETTRTLPLRTPDGEEQRDIEVVIQYVRVDPVSSHVTKSEQISYPR